MHRLARTCPPIVAVLAASLLLGGCDERTGAPVAPGVDGGPQRWRTVHPDRPVPDLGCIFALDADDVWIGGRGGQMLHLDGRGVTHHEIPDLVGAVREIHGCAWDEVWARAGDRLYRWDGRRWRSGPGADPERRLTTMCLWNDAPGVLYTGGRDAWTGRGYVQSWRDGRGWKRWPLGDPGDLVTQIWRPTAVGPLLALVSGGDRRLYVEDGRGWSAMPIDGRVRRARGSFLVVTRDDAPGRQSAYRLGRDGRLVLLCSDFDWDNDILLDCRHPLFPGPLGLEALIGCRRRLVLEVPDLYQSLGHDERVAVPRRPGSRGSCLFLLSGDDEVHRIAWRDDESMASTVVYGVPPVVPETALRVAGETLLAIDRQQGLAVGTPAGWHRHDLGGRRASELALLADGSVLVSGSRDGNTAWFGRRHPDGAWSWYPELPGVTSCEAWCEAATGDLYAMTGEAEFRICSGGRWTTRDVLGGTCWFYGAVAVDQQYARVNLPDLGPRIVMFDGSRWRDVTLDLPGWVFPLLAAPVRGELIARHEWFDGDGFRSGLLHHDGAGWRHGHVERSLVIHYGDVHESRDGAIHRAVGHRVLRLHDHGWKPVADLDRPDYPGHGLRSFWVDPDRGLFVIDDLDQVHHLPSVPR